MLLVPTDGNDPPNLPYVGFTFYETTQPLVSVLPTNGQWCRVKNVLLFRIDFSGKITL